MCWGRCLLVKVAVNVTSVPTFFSQSWKVHCAGWDMGREVQKSQTWIRHSWVQLRIFRGWLLASVQSLQALIWREHKNPCQEAQPKSHHSLVKPQFLTPNIFILGVKASAYICGIIYVRSTILPKLKSSHYSALICILLEDSLWTYELGHILAALAEYVAGANMVKKPVFFGIPIHSK